MLLSERRRLTDLAYRLLGSLAEAEDAVQETYARWYAMTPERRDAVRVPGAWLTTVAGRICLDLLGSARARRERYVGAWLPEPLPDRAEGGGRAADPADLVTLDESVHMAFLVVLESMTPAERVAFVLHDVFAYPFGEVAEIVGRSPAACRQLASSARRRIDGARAPAGPPAAGQAGVVRDFKQAWEAKDIEALVGLLDPAAVMTADGGGLVGTVLRPVEGGARIADYLLFIAGKAPGLRLRERSVGGRPGLVAEAGGAVVTVAAFDLAEDGRTKPVGRIGRIWVVRNPEKLRPWTGG
ncbi:RNA polymerase sigma factor SigJ [Streptomyces sp. NPDC048659]|uniref:RNA polymerase sigma factor SigJ n=1 Tax=Streptomyces sp. NPDC048659 TaxID=3155489 RepID=UPI003444C5C4